MVTWICHTEGHADTKTATEISFDNQSEYDLT